MFFNVTEKNFMHTIENLGVRLRRFRPRNRLLANPFGAIALINLGLLFMLFAFLLAPFARQPALNVQLPGASLLSGAPYGLLVVTITQEGLVFFDDKLVPLNTLTEALLQAARTRQIQSLTIEADLRVPYGTLARVMNMAAAAGLREVHLATRPLFGEEVMP